MGDGASSIEEPAGVFAGFTPQSYTGGNGGRTGMHQICAAAFAGSHLCHSAEFYAAESSVAPPVGGAWIDPSLDESGGFNNNPFRTSGRYVTTNVCNYWTDGTVNFSGYIAHPSGYPTSGGCAVSRPLACCTTPARTRFLGFTLAATTGGVGGRHAMHRLCELEYPGSHFCHAAEYFRANSGAAVPMAGAWIDPSYNPNGGFNNNPLPRSGRFVTTNVCNYWTDGTVNFSGYILHVNGYPTSGTCSVARSLACCGI